jgi:glutamate-ammonia-ligase adenylyltransferase
MTASSDLDLVFVYDAPDDVEASDGEKALAVPLYYARLAQRFIAALTAHTAQGGLYDVDMRLRPTGNKGPVAVSLESFRRYHVDDSWTWEHLALTRARVVHAPVALAEKVEAIIHATLTKPSDPAILFRDAREMREKLAAQFPGRNTWDLKYTRGGMIDIEFAVQTLQLRDAHHTPEVLHTNTIAALENLARAGSLAKADAEGLIAAAHLQNALMQTLRIAIDGVLDPGAATEGLKALLARIGGAPDFGQLTARLAAAQATARAAYEKIMATA